MRRYFRAVYHIMRAYQLRFYRDKTALFFTFLFPVVFLLIFGSIFNNTNVSFSVGLINNSQSEFAKQFVTQSSEAEVLEVSIMENGLTDAKDKMSRGEVNSIIVLPEAFGAVSDDGRPAGELVVYYDPGSEQTGQAVEAIMEQTLDGINAGLGQPEAPFTVRQESTESKGLRPFDYTFSGLIGFSIMSAAIYGLATVMPAEKQRGAFRRLRASPAKASQLLLGNGLHYLVITLLSVGIMVAVGLMVFGFDMRGSWLQFGAFAAIASLMMIGFGLAIGAWARNENQASPIANLIALPLMFLSGIFFPRFLFPGWMQVITDYIPLSPVIDGFRRIMTENATLLDLGPQLGVIAVWGIVVYVIAVRLFRWE